MHNYYNYQPMKLEGSDTKLKSLAKCFEEINELKIH